MSSSTHRPPQTPKLHILTLNVWGLLLISSHRKSRLQEIGHSIATTTPKPDIVCLQECWVHSDFLTIRELTTHILPYGKFSQSGVFGTSGLVVLSRWRLEESSMECFPLNGRPTAFFRGDWYVGKGVACARVRVPHKDCVSSQTVSPICSQPQSSSSSDENTTTITLLNTHLHAPYEPPHRDTYLVHRTHQAHYFSRLALHAREHGHLVLGLGDFNMTPDSLAYRLVTAHGGLSDAWRCVYPDEVVDRERNRLARKRMNGDETGRRMSEGEARARTVEFGIMWEGNTCDSAANTWRWPKARRRGLQHPGTSRDAIAASNHNRDKTLDLEAHDPHAKRLDYIFVGQPVDRWPKHEGGDDEKKKERGQWQPTSASVGFTRRHPSLNCSLSDHFSVSCTLSLLPNPPPPSHSSSFTVSTSSSTSHPSLPPLPPSAYNHILSDLTSYIHHQTTQRRYRLLHFALSVLVTIACWIAIWWSPHNGVAFALCIVASLGLGAGVLDGVIGGLSFGDELGKLQEWREVVEGWVERAVDGEG